tara:strand:+ start:23639 stop:25138 length:1500 start_codon:yes stop_codon:yes gene_type:complete
MKQSLKQKRCTNSKNNNKNKMNKSLRYMCLLSLGLVAAPNTWANSYPDVRSMFEAIRPDAPVIAPDINAVILAIDALPTEQQKNKAYSTLAPRTDLSLIATSDSANRAFVKRLNRRLLEIKTQTGVSSGDDWDDIFDDEDEAETTTGASTATPAADKPKKASTPKSEPKKTTNSNVLADEDLPLEPELDENEPGKHNFSFSKPEPEPEEVEAVLDPDKGVWFKIYGSETAQKNRDNIYGYDATLLGGFLGRDWLVNDNTVIGVAAGYAQADIDSRGPSGTYMDTKRLSGSIYGYYNFPSGLYTMGIITLAHNDYDNVRKILVPPVGGFGVSTIAHADFSAWESYVHVEFGYDWQCKNWTVQPKIFSSFTHLNVESYQEMDAFAYNLNVRNHNIDNLLLGGGFLTEYHYKFKRATVAPFMHAYVMYDFLKDKQTTLSNFQGGGYNFLTQGAVPGGTTFEVGGGLSLHSYKDVMFDLQYDFATRSGLIRNTVSLKLRYQWA